MTVDLTDVWGKPRYYKTIPIYPIRMKDAPLFYETVQTLNIPKNSLQNPEFIKMSYIRFLLVMGEIDSEFKHIVDKFIILLKLVFRAEKVEFRSNEKGRLFVLLDDTPSFNELEFPKIKKIISEQNMVDLDVEHMNADVKKKIQEAREFMARKGNASASIDQRIIAYRCVSKQSYEEIQEMTLYQFGRELETYSLIFESEAIRQARYSGMVSFKDESKLPTWLSAIEKAQDSAILDANETLNKLEKTING